MEIRAVNLSFSFGRRTVLDRVSLVVPEGSVFVLLGPSGSGKTTLFRLLAGFLRPDEGEIYLGGARVSSPRELVAPRKRRIGMVFQSLALWPHISALGHVRLAGGAEAGPRMLEALGLAGEARCRPDQLSGGQKQRLSVARALAGEPRILLLDEPFSHLDPPYRYEVNQLLGAMWKKGRQTVLLVTHDPREVTLPVDGCLLLEEGRLYGPRPIGDLVEQSQSRYARLMRSYLGREA
jgi:ABC-type Fe3+/spermidine/putrescine transport system ATPase subunit